jgi:hypothetical protein
LLCFYLKFPMFEFATLENSLADTICYRTELKSYTWLNLSVRIHSYLLENRLRRDGSACISFNSAGIHIHFIYFILEHPSCTAVFGYLVKPIWGYLFEFSGYKINTAKLFSTCNHVMKTVMLINCAHVKSSLSRGLKMARSLWIKGLWYSEVSVLSRSGKQDCGFIIFWFFPVLNALGLLMSITEQLATIAHSFNMFFPVWFYSFVQNLLLIKFVIIIIPSFLLLKVCSLLSHELYLSWYWSLYKG